MVALRVIAVSELWLGVESPSQRPSRGHHHCERYRVVWPSLHAPVLFGALLPGGVVVALGIRRLSAWRARALLTRMQEAGAGEAPAEGVMPEASAAE
jgi:hypothetical protein